MNRYIHQFQAYIEQHPTQRGHDDILSILELLYQYYTEQNPIDTDEIRAGFREIDRIISGLSVQDNDRVFTLVFQLCVQHERQAFLEGLRVGIQLFSDCQKPALF